jgi:hypothetical protein
MSNYLNFSVTTQDELCNWILRSLGHPLVQVELHEDHLRDAMNDAIEEFTKFMPQDRKYLALNLEDYDEDNGFVLSELVTGIFAIEDGFLNGASSSTGINTLFSVPNTMWNAGMIPAMGFGGSGGSWIDYEAAIQYLDLTKRMTGSGAGSGSFYFNYNERERRLILTPNPIKQSVKGYIALGVNMIRPDDQQYGESWVKRYALALCKIKLGLVRSKYQGSVQLLGGGQLDTSIKDEGYTEKSELEEELWNAYGRVCDNFFIG